MAQNNKGMMQNSRPKKKGKSKQNQDIASERIKDLFAQAGDIFDKSPSLSDRYVAVARRLSMKYKVKMPVELKRQFCRHCHAYLKQGKNCRTRISGRKVVYHCANCGKYLRVPIPKK